MVRLRVMVELSAVEILKRVDLYLLAFLCVVIKITVLLILQLSSYWHLWFFKGDFERKADIDR